MNEQKTKPGWRILRRIFIGVAIFATLVAIFYTEEGWRGKRAWENCKREYEVRGFVVDWDKLIPPPVPDDQNFFKAPNMSEWFVRGFVPVTHPFTNELAEHLKPQSLSSWASNNPVVLAELTFLPFGVKADEEADLVLKCSSSDPALFLPDSFSEENLPPVPQENPDTNNVIPIIQFQDVPITKVIESLFRQGGLGDSIIAYDVRDENGQIKPEFTISVRFENLTARQVLAALYYTYRIHCVQFAGGQQTNLTLVANDWDAKNHVIYADPLPVSTNDSAVPIEFNECPITTAIENLARVAGINYLLDPKIGYGWPDKNGKIKPEPTVTVKWNGISAREALLALLDNYGLRLIYNSNEGIARVILKNPGAPVIYASPDLRGKIKQLLQNIPGPYVDGAHGDTLLEKSRAEIKPVHVIFHVSVYPGDQEIIALFSQFNTNDTTQAASPKLRVEHIDLHHWRVVINAYPAADYLAWSDQLQPDFNQIREALKRPYARIDGDYSKPSEIGIPNFITVRSMAQTLAQRAQCHFLLNQPEQALDDLTRMHEMRLILEGAPTHKPMTLVAAMINVAVAGLYVDTINEGFRLHAWQEPQLAALQKQLEEKKLTPFVSDALKTESVAVCRDFQIMLPNKIFDWNATNSSKLWYLWPRGWTYQNMANIFTQETRSINGFNSTDNTISPRYFEEAGRNVDKFVAGSRWSPYKLLAAVAIPNFVRAWQTTAHNQTMINESQIACALERYKLANGNYPETLDALVPQFIGTIPHDIIGGQPLHYRRTDHGNFLLYSVGWNETDDGGQQISSPTKYSAIDYTKGDWVWR